MGKKKSNNLIGVLKDDVKALSFQAAYNALVEALLKMVPDTSISDEKLQGLVAGAIYYYFAKNQKYGANVSMAIRLEAMGDVISVFGESIPFAGSLVKNYVSPYIEGDEDERINFISGLRDMDIVNLEGYDPETDTFKIEGSKQKVNIIENV